MKSHPITRELANWWTRFGGKHDSPEWAAYLADFRTLLATKHDELTSEHDNEGRFGMSRAAGCTRDAVLGALGHEGEPFDGDDLFTFHIGHTLECMVIASLRACGYTLDVTQARVRIEPFMSSMSDSVITGGRTREYIKERRPDADDQDFDIAQMWPAILSVKSAGYKNSSQTRGKFMRRGFAALPFDGIYKGNFSAWCQAQAEMHGSGIPRTLVVVVAKDIVKVFKNDPYMKESGSLSFYAELVEYDPRWCATELVPVWQQAWDAKTDCRGGVAHFFNPETGRYVRLPKPGDTESGWGGPNQQATNLFNPCYQCKRATACKAELASSYRRAA